jgi:hypothetical protein
MITALGQREKSKCWCWNRADASRDAGGRCAGLRDAELRGLQGRHFTRAGFVWVSGDIAKGVRERWVPVIPDHVPVVADICAGVREREYVLPAQRFRDLASPRLDGTGRCGQGCKLRSANKCSRGSGTTPKTPRGDDRNRTGVNGFAERPTRVFVAFVCGFWGPQVASDDARNRWFGAPLGRPAHRRRTVGKPEGSRVRIPPGMEPRGKAAGFG